MTSWRVLRLLLVILLVVLWFLVAWTSAVCQNPELSRALIAAGLTPEGLQFSMCLLDRWDYMMAVGTCVMPGIVFTEQVRRFRLRFPLNCKELWGLELGSRLPGGAKD